MHAKAHRRKFPHFGAVIILSRDIDRYSYSEGPPPGNDPATVRRYPLTLSCSAPI
jgi:hypothetical protein